MTSTFKDRINFNGHPADIATHVSKVFSLGSLLDFHLIEMGYEDFNLAIRTTQGKYLAKIFGTFRNLSDCRRYLEVMERVIAAGVNHPKLHGSPHLYVGEVSGTVLRACVMDFIEGESFFKSKTGPTEEDIEKVAHQAALVNSLDIRPVFVYDDWAIPNFAKEFELNKSYLELDDLKLIETFAKRFSQVRVNELPRCLVHGDLHSTNIIKDTQGSIWLLDFAVANNYPRINEMAVLASDFLFDRRGPLQTQTNIALALSEYRKSISLTPYELEVFPIIIDMAQVMHVLKAAYEKAANKNASMENQHWLELGRAGLRQTLSRQ